jgi:phospholipase/carboxylesterase
MADDGYSQAVNDAEEKLLAFLRTFESTQENMRVERLGEFQGQLREVAPDGFDGLIAGLGRVAPPDSMLRFHDAFTAAIRHLGNASRIFLNASENSYSLAGLDLRRALCRGLNLLYGIRADTPTLQQYWLLPDAAAVRDALETPSPDADAPVGVIHRRRAAPLADYSLYVPESYTPSRSWPLIVCLHGAYGRGDHFIWSWLRPAKSRGYMLLAPKSLDVTWSILQPERDTRSVAAMLDEVCGEYAVARSRVYLSGLSDGGTFTYLLGLGRPELFAGIAPVAADFTGMMDDMLRRKQGIGLPICIAHGAQDHIFPVDPIRRGHALLQRLGYNARYEELPDWGHSHCSGVNERVVMPWFEGLSEL